MQDSGGLLEISLHAVEVDKTFATHHPPLHPGPHVRITIRDTGHGMDAKTLERIFEPFFTTKNVGEGTGMGLAVAHGIVTSHGGAIVVQSKPGAGTTVALYFPRLSETAKVPDNPAEPIPQGNERLLLIDDEEMLATLGHDMLARLGYTVVARTSSVEALDLFRAEPHAFDLVITDQTMPTMTGESLAKELRHIRPDIPIILCTGFSHSINADKAQDAGIDAFCQKPLVAHALAQEVRRVLDRRATEVF
jgi:CheY-like chemotaxis protein